MIKQTNSIMWGLAYAGNFLGSIIAALGFIGAGLTTGSVSDFMIITLY